LRGRRNLDHGDEAIGDRVARAALRRRGLVLFALSMALATAMSAALLALP
jgi:hypothetical protein